jgi:biotin synthase
MHYTDDVMCDIVASIKALYPDCAITLSLGERSYDSYKKLYDAGADRYLLRHETADSLHYGKLHPENLSLDNRMECLENLKKIGFQVGCGFMVGSPYQTTENLAKDLKFIEEFKPDMCGIGPFIPHKDTIFANEEAGSADLTCYLLSIIRLIHPNILLPATMALSTASPRNSSLSLLAN